MNFPPPVNPDDLGRGPLIMGLSLAITVVALVAVGLRLYVRKTVVKHIASDDWLMLLALAFHLVSVGFVSVAYHHGMGKHDASLTPFQMVDVLKWMWLASTPGLLTSITARISIAILLVRLFGVYEWLKWFVIATITACSLITLAILPCTYLQTTPVSGNWNILDPNVTRWDPSIYIGIAFTGQALWAFSDLTLVLFPVAIVWRLNMPLRQRVGLIVLLAVSLFTVAMSILKTVGLQAIADQQSDPTATDVQYNASLSILWTLLEQACVIIMGCVPPLRAVAKLEIARSVSWSLSSLLRRGGSSGGKSSQPSSSSSSPWTPPSFVTGRSNRSYKKHTNNTGNSDAESAAGGGGLELRPDLGAAGRFGGNKGGSSPYAVTAAAGTRGESQRDLIKGNDIYHTTELNVSYHSNPSRGSDTVWQG